MVHRRGITIHEHARTGMTRYVLAAEKTLAWGLEAGQS